MSDVASETVVVELERGEVERLVTLCEYDIRHTDAGPKISVPSSPVRDKTADKLRAALASDSQGEERCAGDGRVLSEESPTGAVACPGCPKCQPEQGEDGDWPEIVVGREPGGGILLADELIPSRETETRRYVPAPTQPSISEEDREQLEEIARVVDNYAPESRAKDDAAFLRRLASAPPATDRPPEKLKRYECEMEPVSNPRPTEPDERPVMGPDPDGKWVLADEAERLLVEARLAQIPEAKDHDVLLSAPPEVSGEETDRKRADRLEVECRELEDANRSLAKMRDAALEGNLAVAASKGETTMPDQSLPEGVERFDMSGFKPATMERRDRGTWIKYADLPAIIEQARSQEYQRVRELCDAFREKSQAANDRGDVAHGQAWDEAADALEAALDTPEGSE